MNILLKSVIFAPTYGDFGRPIDSKLPLNQPECVCRTCMIWDGHFGTCFRCCR